jgi:hypothetical protein
MRAIEALMTVHTSIIGAPLLVILYVQAGSSTSTSAAAYY